MSKMEQSVKSSTSPLLYIQCMYVCIKAYNYRYRLVGSNEVASPSIKLVFASVLANMKLTLAIFSTLLY